MRSVRYSWFWMFVFSIVVLGSQMGHGGCSCGGDEVFGPPTESTCPQDSTLTYENFGKPFMEQYCTQCHSSELVGEQRMGAPSFHDFDSLVGIKQVSEHIDWAAAAGPVAINRGMPPADEPQPSDAERYQLGEWIACGMPE